MRIAVAQEGTIDNQINDVDEKVYELLKILETPNKLQALSKSYDLLHSALSVVISLEELYGVKRKTWQKKHYQRLRAKNLEAKRYIQLHDDEEEKYASYRG